MYERTCATYKTMHYRDFVTLKGKYVTLFREDGKGVLFSCVNTKAA